MKASDLFVECLEAEGVEYVFGLPGEEIEDLLFSLRDSSVEFVETRHEQGAAFMANVQGRLTGEAGVCLSTLGPGATNLLTGVADAEMDRAPLVAVTGQKGREELHHEAHQALDVVNLFRPVTEWNTHIGHPGVVNEAVRKAFKVAEFEKPGATHLEFPEDVAKEEVGSEPLPGRDRVRRPEPDLESVDRAAELVRGAERPVVLAGNGAVRMDASRCLRQFVEATGVPVVATYMGKGAISDRDPHSLMTIHSGPDGEAVSVLREADLVVAVGYDIAEHDPSQWNPSGETSIVHVDHEPAEVYEKYNPEVEVVADVSSSLCELVQPLREGFEVDDEWYRERRERIVRHAGAEPEGEFDLRGVVATLRAAMGDEDVLISDVGSHKMEIARSFRTFEPETCLISNGLASMGISLPGAVAADLVTGEEVDVVSVSGDGGFLMNAAELETAVREGCGFTAVVLNDERFGLIAEKQRGHRDEEFGVGFGNPDFAELAESFGVVSCRPGDYGELKSVLGDYVPSGEMCLVEIPLGGGGRGAG